MTKQLETIRDSFDKGKLSNVMKIGNTYIFMTDGAEFAEEHAKAIASISDWRDGSKPATQANLRSIFIGAGFIPETRYDAAHGRRYKLCVFPRGNPAARRVTLAASDGMNDTNPEIARPIFQ